MVPPMASSAIPITFENGPDRVWVATAQTPTGLLTATGATIDDAREAIEKLLEESLNEGDDSSPVRDERIESQILHALDCKV